MKIVNSLIVPKNVKGGPLGFFNIHSVAKYQKMKGDPLKNFEKKSHNAAKGIVFQGRGLWMRSKSSTEYFW